MNLKKPFSLTALFLMVFSLYGMEFPFKNSHLTDLDGIRIHYRYWEVEEQSPIQNILLVHGFGASTFSWQEVADSLNTLGFAIVAIDVPPFGYSDKSYKINQSITAHAERLHRFVQQEFPGRRWHLAGHSMGGAVSQAYALMYPEDLESVTFVSAALFPELPRTEQPTNLLLRLSPLRFVFGELAEEWFIRERRVERLLTSAYGVEPTDYQVSAYLEPLSIPGTARAIFSAAAYHRELADLDASDLSVPAIAIWGDSDSWVPHKSRRPGLERMPETELVLLENAGHNPMETHFHEFMEAWMPFLRSVTDDSYDPALRSSSESHVSRGQGNALFDMVSNFRSSISQFLQYPRTVIEFLDELIPKGYLVEKGRPYFSVVPKLVEVFHIFLLLFNPGEILQVVNGLAVQVVQLLHVISCAAHQALLKILDGLPFDISAPFFVEFCEPRTVEIS